MDRVDEIRATLIRVREYVRTASRHGHATALEDLATIDKLVAALDKAPRASIAFMLRMGGL